MKVGRKITAIGIIIIMIVILMVIVACTKNDIQPQTLKIDTTIEQKGSSRYFNYARYSLIVTLEGQASRIEMIAGKERLQLDAMAIMKLPDFITDMDLPHFLIIAKDENGRELKRIQVNLPQIDISASGGEKRDETTDGDGYYYYDTTEGFWKFYSTVDLTAMSAAERMQIHQDTEHFEPKYVVFNHQYTTLEDYEEHGTESYFIEIQPPFPEEAFNIPQSTSFDPYTQQPITYHPPTIILTSPADETVEHDQIVTLTWEATAGSREDGQEGNAVQITEYQIFLTIEGNPFPTQPIFIIEDKEQKSYTTNLLERGTVYQWKVTVVQSDGATSTSAQRTFSVGPQTQVYSLTLQASPTEAGSVAGGGVFELNGQRFSSWTGSFSEGDEVNIQAIPVTDYLFINWKQGTSTISEDADYTYTMPGEDIDLVAEFEAIIYDYDSPQVQLVSPEDNISNMSTTVTLTWNATSGHIIQNDNREVPGISEYRIFFGENLNWTEPFATLTTSNRPMTYTISGLEYDQEYVWTVEAVQSDTQSSSPTVRYFTTAPKRYNTPDIVLLAPMNGFKSTSTNMTLTWNATPGSQCNTTGREAIQIDSYQLYFGEYGQEYPDPTEVTEKAKDIQGLEFNTTYKWKVEAIQSDGARTMSPEWTFTVCEEVNVYTLTLEASPAGCGSVGAGGVFEVEGQRFSSWTGSYSEGDEVNIQAIPVTDYLFINWKQGTSTISEDADYIYTMPGEDIDLVAEFEAIIYDYDSPQVQLVSPEDNISNMSTTVTLTWNATPGQLIILNDRQAPELTEFRIFFGEDTNWTEPYATMTGDNTPLEFTLSGLEYGQQYMWTVEVMQSDSKSSSPTVRSFTTLAAEYNPPQIEIVEPSSGSTNTSKDPKLIWEVTPGEQTNMAGRDLATFDEYHLYLAPVGQEYPEVPIVVTESEEKSLQDLEFNTVYKWKVEALQCDGATATTQEATFMTEDELVFLYQDGVLINSHGSIYNTVADIENVEPYVIEVTGGITLYEPGESYFHNKKATITSTDDQSFTIDLQNKSRLFYMIYSSQITLENAIVMNGGTTIEPGEGFDGGAVYVAAAAAFTTRNCTFTSNRGIWGGALMVDGGHFIAENTVITQNEASRGGGIVLRNNANFTAHYTTICNNSRGGVFIHQGAVNGYDCSFNYNTGEGGILLRQGHVTLTDSYIIGNESTLGGGIRIGDYKDAYFFANNVLIMNNSAEKGGGVYVEGVVIIDTIPPIHHEYSEGEFFANEVEICGNTASDQGGGIYLANDGAHGFIQTAGKKWATWIISLGLDNFINAFSVNSEGDNTGTFDWEDPVIVHSNTATDNNTNQMKWMLD